MDKNYNKEMLNIVQWNAKSIRHKEIELNKNNINIDFMLISET